MMMKHIFMAEKQQKLYSKPFFRFINCNKIIKIMEHQNILNLSTEASDSKFVTRNRNIVNTQTTANYNAGN